MRATQVLTAALSLTAMAAACSDDDDGGSGETESATTDRDDGALSCGALFSDAEIDQLFGEPYTLSDNFDASLGLLSCTWETIDAAEDDFEFVVLTTQVFTGDPVPAESYYDPTLFDDVRDLDGVGDQAFHSEAGGFYFLDGGVGGLLSLTEVDVSTADDVSRPIEDVEALFRTFAERVTAVT